VPAGEYDAYLDAFDAYNESVQAWHARAEALQVVRDSCRHFAERHNTLVDSLMGQPGGDPERRRPPESGDPRVPPPAATTIDRRVGSR
jgi:hypothetical protein